MPTGITSSAALNEAALEGRRQFLDTGSANARIRLYNGTRPTSGGTATTMLVEIPLDKPCGVVAGGVLTLASTAVPLVANSGNASWARIVNGNGDFAFDCDVSTVAAGTGQIQLEDTSLLAGGKTQLVSGVLGQP